MRQGGIALVSIIYDALQKAQRHREMSYRAPSLEQPKKTLNPLQIMVFIITLLLLAVIGLGMTYLTMPLNKPRHKPVLTSQAPAKPISKPIVRIVKLKLNGVFLSNDENVAMINQDMYRLGDVIEGLKIVSIQLDSVVLQNDKQTLELRAG